MDKYLEEAGEQNRLDYWAAVITKALKKHREQLEKDKQQN